MDNPHNKEIYVANKTIYVTDEDETVWNEAARMLPFYRKKSLSAFIVEKVREYVTEENARQAKK